MIPVDHLISELNRLGIPFITGGTHNPGINPLAPEILIAGLISHSEARVRLAVIPLLLVRPDYGPLVPEIVAQQSPANAVMLKCFYLAASLLQKQHRPQLTALLGLQPALPPYFAAEIDLSNDDSVAQQLAHLGHIHQQQTGRRINWTATYHHAANRLLTRLEKEAQWLA